MRDMDDDFEEEQEDASLDFLKVKSNIEKIEQASTSYTERAEKVVRDLIIAQSPDVIDTDALRKVATIQRKRDIGCLSLPFSVAFFLFFALSTFLHEDITNVYFLESGLRSNIGGGIEAVDSIAGFWNWMHNVFLPTVFHQEDIHGSPEKDKLYWNRVLMYNQLTGPVVIEQGRSKRELCFNGDGIYGDMVCYPPDTMDTNPILLRKILPILSPKPSDYEGGHITMAQRRDFWLSSFSTSKAKRRTRRLFIDSEGHRIPISRRLRIMRTEYMSRLPSAESTWDKKYIMVLSPNTPVDVTLKHAEFLQEGGWVDEQTKEVLINAMFLNAEVGRPRLVQVQIMFRFSRGGGVFAQLTMETIFLKMFNGVSGMVADSAFALMLTMVTSFELVAGRVALREHRFKQHLAKPWTILELLIVFFGWLCVAGYIFQSTLLGVVKRDLVTTARDVQKDLPAEMHPLGEQLKSSLDSMVSFTSWFRILQAEYHLILMFRFFTAFYAQPRLGVVTSTLQASVVDILHFLIVMLPTFMAYSISACFIFGRRMKEFSTFHSSIGVCFKMIMEAEYDWEELSAEHYWTAALWTWTFMLLVVVIMLNMVLAIVMDVYRVKHQAAGNSETVFVSLFNLYTRFRHFRVWVSNGALIDGCSTMKELITRADMLKAFPGMCDEQLDVLFASVKSHTEFSSGQGIDIHDSMKMIMAVTLSMDKVNQDMRTLQEGDDNPISFHEECADTPWLSGLVEQLASQSHWMLGMQWKLQQLQWQWSAMDSCHGSS